MLHLQAADELGGNLLGGAGEEEWEEVLGGRGGYGSGFEQSRHISAPGSALTLKIFDY